MTNQTPDPVEPAADASHPDVETLADLSEDLLAPAEAAALRTHLAACPECADTLAALTEVAALLAAEPVEPMPAEIALRIDAALAAAQPPSAPNTPNTPNTPSTPSAPPPAATAGRGTAGPPARSDRSSRPGGARSRRRRLVLAVAGCLAALGLGATGLVLSQQGGSQPTAASAVGPNPEQQHPLSVAGPEFTAAGLSEQIDRLLPSGSGGQPHASAQQSGGGLPDCVQQSVTGHQGETPLLITHGGYRGAPVDVYVFRLADDPGRLDVFLLTPGCTTTPAAVQLEQQIPAR
ncbi:hypothetical protein E6W39_21315 [Kitasatospora acidiphila]|uniref:Zinc-finger domain-containing protein n=1 Tax=Kitasatospora acidiphila TaxID=2567942 RepID=A0A540W5J5_9ACTN|nr:hypothetical protein [Kitasatospora acidiphila]TQF04299.1 hypothetical protein E6W39_21315 [Kitasatospora acidiphila]